MTFYDQFFWKGGKTIPNTYIWNGSLNPIQLIMYLEPLQKSHHKCLLSISNSLVFNLTFIFIRLF